MNWKVKWNCCNVPSTTGAHLSLSWEDREESISMQDWFVSCLYLKLCLIYHSPH